MTAAATDVQCPKCGGAMWDNRATKTNPKAPDYKCRDRTCDGVIWPPKPSGASGGSAPHAPQPAAAPRAAVSYGAPEVPGAPEEAAPASGAVLMRRHAECLDYVLTVCVPRMQKAGIEPTADAVARLASQVFGARNHHNV